jgi:superfamily I DNA/RNA helicase
MEKTYDLTPEQQAIVDWVQNGSGSAVVRARAGTGKTFTLERIVEVLPNVDPRDIVLCGFNRSIVKELKHRIKRDCWIATIHSLGLNLWRKQHRSVAVNQYKVRDIVRAMNNKMYEDMEAPIERLVSIAKQAGVGFMTGVENRSAWYNLADHHAINDVPAEYGLDGLVDCSINIMKRSINMDEREIDFDDMIVAPLIHKARIWPKKWVLVDEAQDLSPARRALIQALAGEKGRMIFVGDDRQAIYGFTGADVTSIEKIVENTGAVVLPLTTTFRCGKTIVEKAQALVPDINAWEGSPDGKVFYGEDMPEPGRGDAVIARRNAVVVSMAYTFLAGGTACRVEGREIGTGLKKLATKWKTIRTVEHLLEKLNDYEQREVSKWLARDKATKAEMVKDQIECVRIIARKVQLDADDPETVTVVDVTNEIDRMFGEDVTDVLVLLTAHKSKGREWDRVWIVGYDEIENCFWDRQPWEKQQSLNLAYVALTRAKLELYIS